MKIGTGIKSLALVLASGALHASEWVPVATGGHGQVQMFVDVSSILLDGGIERAWVKTVYVTHTKWDADDRKWWSYQLQRDAVNCAEGSHRGGGAYNLLRRWRPLVSGGKFLSTSVGNGPTRQRWRYCNEVHLRMGKEIGWPVHVSGVVQINSASTAAAPTKVGFDGSILIGRIENSRRFPVRGSAGGPCISAFPT